MKRKMVQDHNRGRQSNEANHVSPPEPKSQNTVVLIEGQGSNNTYNNGDMFGKFAVCEINILET